MVLEGMKPRGSTWTQDYRTARRKTEGMVFVRRNLVCEGEYGKKEKEKWWCMSLCWVEEVKEIVD